MFRSLHKDYSRIITKADKGNTIVVLDSDDYNKNVREILNDSNTYEQIATHPTEKSVKEVRRDLSYLKGKVEITDRSYKSFCPRGCTSPRFYDLPKMHKPGNPVRPIVSSFNSPTQKIGKFLSLYFAYLFRLKNPILKIPPISFLS